MTGAPVKYLPLSIANSFILAEVSALIFWLDENTGINSLQICCSYGRVEELVFFASLKEQYEIVIHYYIQVL